MKIIAELEALVSSKFKEYRALGTIMHLESKLAVQSVSPLLLSVCVVFFVLISIWFTTMAIIAYGAYLVFDNLFFTLLFILILNACFLYGLVKFIQYNLNNMSFEKTRNYFSMKENDHGIEKKIDYKHSTDGSKITSS